MISEGPIPPPKESYGRAAESAEPIGEVTRNIAAAWVAAQIYLATQVKRLRLAFRTFLLVTLFTCVGAVFGVSIVISASVLLMVGIADGLASLLGGRQWAGDLITGMGVVLTVVIAGYLLVSKLMKSARSRTMAGYEKPNMRN